MQLHAITPVRFQGRLQKAEKKAVQVLGPETFTAVTQELERQRHFIEKRLSDNTTVTLNSQGEIAILGFVKGLTEGYENDFSEGEAIPHSESDSVSEWVLIAMSVAQDMSDKTKEVVQRVAAQQKAWQEYEQGLETSVKRWNI